MSERRYDMATNRWYELVENDNGDLVEIAVPDNGNAAMPGEKTISAKIEQDPDYQGVPSDMTSTRYGRELEQAAKMAMAEEQQKNGFQYSLDQGFALATQNPEDEKRIANAARTSTKQACYEANKILTKKAVDLVDKDPAQAKLYSDYAEKIRRFGDEIQTEFQDKWHGTNLRYGTPIGSGREGVPYSSTRPGANYFIRPELAGKTYEQAMDDTLYTSYGKQTLGNRINTARNYQKNNNPWLQVGYSAIPFMNQYQNIQNEGLGLGDLSATGALGQIGSAGLQGLGEFITGAGAYPLGIASIVGSEILGAPDRPKSDEEVGDVLKDVAASTAGAVVGNVVPGALAKKLAKKGTKKVSGEIAELAADPKLEKKIEQKTRDVAETRAKLNEQNAIVSGEPEAMQNAFIRAAQQDVAPEDAWKYYNGFLMGEDGLPKTTPNNPYVNYVLRSENSLLSDQNKAISKLGRAERKMADEELALKHWEDNTPSEAVALRDEKYLKELKELAQEKELDKGVELEEDINMLKRMLDDLDKRPDVIRDQIEYRKQNIADYKRALSNMEDTSSKEYRITSLRLDKEESRLKYAQDLLATKTESRGVKIRRDLSRKQRNYDKIIAHIDSPNYPNSPEFDPKTKGFLTAKANAEGSRTAFNQKQDAFKRGLEAKQLNFNNAKQVVDGLKQEIKRVEDAITQLKSFETQESYKKGAESLLKKQAKIDSEKMEKYLKTLYDELERLKSSRKAVGGSGQSGEPGFVRWLGSKAAGFLKGPATVLGAEQGERIVTPEHKDYVADNKMTIGNPWLNAIESIPLFPTFLPVANGTQERVNKYRGFKK